GAYVAAKRLERGAPAVELLGGALEQVCSEIPFRKSMRWSDGDTAFGRPVRWLVGLFRERAIPVSFAGPAPRRNTHGHRFLSPGAIRVGDFSAYLPALRKAHVLVDLAERREHLLGQLRSAADLAGGELIEDEFLVDENASLVEEPHVF